MKLQASKMRLYRLVKAHYLDIPSVHRTEFVKAPRSRAWWLNFDDPSGRRCKFFFSTCLGRAYLSFERGASYKTLEIPLDELKAFDLVEEDGTDEKNA